MHAAGAQQQQEKCGGGRQRQAGEVGAADNADQQAGDEKVHQRGDGRLHALRIQCGSPLALGRVVEPALFVCLLAEYPHDARRLEDRKHPLQELAVHDGDSPAQQAQLALEKIEHGLDDHGPHGDE